MLILARHGARTGAVFRAKTRQPLRGAWSSSAAPVRRLRRAGTAVRRGAAGPRAAELSSVVRVASAPLRFANYAFGLWWVRRSYRAARNVALGGVIFASGRQLGLVEYASDPAAKEAELLEGVARGAGATRLHVCGVDEASCPAVAAHEGFVEPIVRRCLEGARLHAVEELRRLEGRASPEEAAAARERAQRVSGAWKVVIFGTSEDRPPMVNAFVSGVCPRTVFVSEGLLDVLKPTPDELGFCVGHELSHLLLGHTEEKAYVRAAVAVAQLAALAFLDPSGLLAFAGAEALSLSSQLLLASHSRDHEDEADLTGLKIAASACFDATRGADFMAKLADHSGHAPATWLATHPSSDDRVTRLVALAATIHRDVPEYADRCKVVKSCLRRFVFDEPKRPWYRRSKAPRPATGA